MSDTTNAFRLAFFTAVIYISALTVGLRLLYYLAYVLAAVLVVGFLWAQINKRGLKVRRSVEPPQAQVGQVIKETIEVENTSRLPKLWLEVRDRSTLPGHQVGAVVSLKGRQGKRWQVRTRCLKRGLYRLGPTHVITGDPFGLFSATRIVDQKGELLVFPPTVPLQSFGLPPNELPGGNRTQRRTYHSTPSAAGLRDYLPGDPMNRIHWPITARLQKLVVKEFELDPTSDIWIVLDLDEEVQAPRPDDEENQVAYGVPVDVARARRQQGSPPTTEQADSKKLRIEPATEEYGIVVAASLAAYYIEQGRSVGMIAWGQHKVTLPADRGGRQLVKILRALAVLRAEGTTPLAEVLTGEGNRFDRQDTIIVVTPSLDDNWVAALEVQLYKSLKAAAVLVEPGTFGGEGNPLVLVSALSVVNVPTFLVKRDDAIDASLSYPAGPVSMRNLR